MLSRIARRLGFTKEKNPERIERELMSLFPRKDWGKLDRCAHCPREGCMQGEET